MSKVKYYYDPDTLSYRKIEPKKSKRVRNIILFFSPTVIFLFIGYQLMYHDKFPYNLIWGDGPMVKHKLRLASNTIYGMDKTISSTQQHIQELVHFSEQMSKTIKQNEKKVTRLENQAKVLKTELSVTRYELNQEIKLKNRVIDSQDSLISLLSIRSDSTAKQINTIRNEGVELIAPITELYDEKHKYDKLIYTAFGVLLTQFINYTINKRNARKRMKKAYEKARLNKKAFDTGFQSVKEIWAAELVDTKQELKIKTESHTRLQLILNDTERIVVKLIKQLKVFDSSFLKENQKSAIMTEQEKKFLIGIIKRYTK